MPQQTLRKLCLLYIGENAHRFDTDSFKDLPVSLLKPLQRYLSAYELHRLQPVFDELGVSTKASWWTHLHQRWPKRHQRVAHVFHGDDIIEDPHQRYFEKHFRELLQQLQFDPYLDTQRKLSLSLHKILMSSDGKGELGYERYELPDSLTQHLVYYGCWVRRLSILGVQCHNLLQQSRLMEVLKDSVEALDLHLVQDRMYPYIRRLVAYLLKQGRLRSVMLYNTRLSDTHMRDLLAICSGCYCLRESQGKATADTGLFKDSDEPSTLKSLLAVGKDSAANYQELSYNQPKSTSSECSFDYLPDSHYYDSSDTESDSTKADSQKSASPEPVSEPSGNAKETAAEESNFDADELFDTAVCSMLEHRIKDNFHRHSNSSKRKSLDCVEDSREQPIPVLQSKKRKLSHVASGAAELYEAVPSTSFDMDAQPTVSIIGDHSGYLENINPSLTEESVEEWSHSVQCLGEAGERNRGLEQFVMMFTGLCQLDKHLQVVLPHWTNLRKLAISHTILHNQDLQKLILSLLLNGQLTDLVIEDTKMSSSIMDFIALAMTGKQAGVSAINALTISNVVKPLSPVNFSPPSDFPTKWFEGVKHLNLSCNEFSEAGVKLLCSLVCKDTALSSLKLNGCWLSKLHVAQILVSLQENKSIRKLNLSDIVSVGDVFNEVINLLQVHTCITSLILNNCALPKVVGGDEFLDTIMKHPSLEELSLSGNHLGDAGCSLLLKLGQAWRRGPSSPRPHLTHLNLGFNQITGEALMECGQQLVSDLEAGGLSRPLSNLSLTGNKILQQHRSLLALYSKVTHSLEAYMVDDISVPFAEHVAQM